MAMFYVANCERLPEGTPSYSRYSPLVGVSIDIPHQHMCRTIPWLTLLTFMLSISTERQNKKTMTTTVQTRRPTCQASHVFFF